MVTIFISYSRADQDRVKILVQDLEDDHETWHDQDLTGGHIWWDTILSRIRDCDIFISALTQDSLESQACKQGREYARAPGKPVLPVLLSDQVQMTSLPAALSQIQCVDYRLQDKQALSALRRSIKSLPKAPPLPDPLPSPPPIPASYQETLKEMIETEAALELKDQIFVVYELRNHFRNGRPADEITNLLRLLKKRDDLRAKASDEIDSVLDEIRREQRAPSNGKKPAAVAKATQKESRQDQVLDDETENETKRHFQLDSPVEEYARIMQRVVNHGECWVFRIDTNNSFTIRMDSELQSPPGTSCVTAKADLRDNVSRAKANELKALDWKVSTGTMLKGALGGAALYVTGGLAAAALLSRGVRDLIMTFEGTRSWIVRNDTAAQTGASAKNALIGAVVRPKDAAAEFALAVQRTAGELRNIIIERQEAEAQPTAR